MKQILQNARNGKLKCEMSPRRGPPKDACW